MCPPGYHHNGLMVKVIQFPLEGFKCWGQHPSFNRSPVTPTHTPTHTSISQSWSFHTMAPDVFQYSTGCQRSSINTAKWYRCTPCFKTQHWTCNLCVLKQILAYNITWHDVDAWRYDLSTSLAYIWKHWSYKYNHSKCIVILMDQMKSDCIE